MWKEARGKNLRKEAEDAIMRLGALPEDVNIRAADTLATMYHHINNESGPIENISNKGKIKLSKMLNSKARQSFEMDMGRGYGLALLSMYLESLCLPGNDAKFVHESTEEFLVAAIKVSEEIDETIEANKHSV